MIFRPFRKCGVVSSHDLCSKWHTPHMTMPNWVLWCDPTCCWHCCRQISKGQMNYLTSSMFILSILNALKVKITSWNVWRKIVSKKWSWRESYMGSAEVPVFLPREAYCVRVSGKQPELLGSFWGIRSMIGAFEKIKKPLWTVTSYFSKWCCKVLWLCRCG